jgi:hypothetical protein
MNTGPSPAGIYDYILGGTHNTAADREAAEKAIASAPETRTGIVENRAFVQRAVRYIAARGVRQYIDIGSGYPTAGPVHEVAAEVVAGPHVLYVDYDPAVIAVAREIIRSADVAAIVGDVREPEEIIDAPETRRLIDWSEPVAVLMAALLHFVSDDENPSRIVAAFRDRMAAGSYLVLSHGSFGGNREAVERGAGNWNRAASQMNVRTPEEIGALFAGFELIAPGLVTAQEWGTDQPAPVGQGVVVAGVGRRYEHQVDSDDRLREP